MLWIDKYAPREFADLTLHSEVSHILKRFVDANSLPHLIFNGPPGSGKALRAHLLLKEIFGDGVDKCKTELVSVEGSKVEFKTIGSNYHAQIFASDLGTQDKACVQLMIKQLANLVSATSFMTTTKPIPRYRVFVIHEAHCLSVTAQASLRRTLERFAASTRVILLTERVSSIILPLKSRCFCVRIPLPSSNEVVQILKRITIAEGVSNSRLTEDAFLKKIALTADNNIRASIILLQKSVLFNSPNNIEPAWNSSVKSICGQIVSDQSVASLLKIRDDLFAILVSCIEPQVLLEVLVRELLTLLQRKSPKQTDDAFIQRIAAAAAFYSHGISNSSKAIFQLEAFITTVMCAISTNNKSTRR